MRRMCSAAGMGLAIVLAVTPAGADPMDHAMDHPMTMMADPSMPAMLHGDLGTFHRAISTRSPAAQKFFDEGLAELFGFDMEGAEASFREAARLDSTCAACWWGVAMSLGPHVNLPALPPRTHAAFEAEAKAQSFAAGASDVERALVEALAKRYVDPQPADPAAELAAETAYADAMRALTARFPSDDDIASLFAESMMDLRPWDYWTADGTPQPGTAEILTTLERVLGRHPNHPLANHLYIHAVEASPHPERGLAAAKRLGTLSPGNGHLVHMPSHIYERVGRYDASAAANQAAIVADNANQAKAPRQGVITMYIAHNRHFLAFTRMMQGQSAGALDAAHQAVASFPIQMSREMPGTDIFLAEPYSVLARFGRWDEMLAVPAPPADLRFLTAMWHYNRGLALAGKGQVDAAGVALDSVRAIGESFPPEALEGFNSAKALVEIASTTLAGRIARQRGNTDEAIGLLEKAVTLEDHMRYDEPSDWIYPVRHALGAALLSAGRPADAEAVYRRDLEVYPGNGWSLFGLAQALRAQKKTAEAARVDRQFRTAWARADVKIAASSF